MLRYPRCYGARLAPAASFRSPLQRAKNDYPPNTIVAEPVLTPTADFSEKLLIDYKWFDYHNITPRFGFGHGLSYTTFKYADSLTVTPTPKSDETSIQPTKRN